jgi:hypothetical protein
MDAAVPFDLASHHALGGGSYVFKQDYPAYLKSLLPEGVRKVEVNIIIQPNSSPHVGTLCSLGLAFAVARKLGDLSVEPIVRCDLWDQAKGEQMEIDGIQYQRSFNETGKVQQFLPDYQDVLKLLGRRYGVSYDLRLEREFLQQPKMADIVEDIIKDRHVLEKHLAPSTRTLAIRAPCPTCGLVDKYSANNIYLDNGANVCFKCPHHGRFFKNVAANIDQLQFNCQLFNLVLGRYYQQVDYGYIQICGSDYAGFWQEQLLWRFLKKPIIVVYTPLISDWSGYKVSKSLYLRPSAYDYLRKAGQEYLLSYAILKAEGKDLNILWEEIERWVSEPYRLFRGYSLHYLHLLFIGHELELGIIHTDQ